MSNTKSFLLEYIQNELKPQIEKEVSEVLKEQELLNEINLAEVDIGDYSKINIA